MLEEIARKYTLLNAVKYGGKASFKAVMGKIISEQPELKSKTEEISIILKKTIDEINNMPLKEQEKLASQYVGLEKEKETKERILPSLPNVDRYDSVIMRLAPYPSGPLHIGNARMVVLNDEYVKRYNGNLLLVFDDTIGSEEKIILPEAYDLILEGLDWLGIKYHKTLYKSDRLPFFYEWCKKLLEKELAYVCICEPTRWREQFKLTQQPCPCRSLDMQENLDRWEKMIDGEYDAGEAAVRLKTGMDADDPALRDHVIMRISDRIHPRVGSKYRVWPLLEFSWAIDDMLLGVTHILRGKDLIKEDRIEQMIWDLLGFESREFIHYGTIRFTDLSLSKSRSRRLIDEGIYYGWTDPRTWSLQSLQKRGFESEAIKQAILDLGLSLTDIDYSPSLLYAINRKMIDPAVNRLFFVDAPRELKVEGAPGDNMMIANPPRHPDYPDRGRRRIDVPLKNGRFSVYISEDDVKRIGIGDTIRLKDLANIEMRSIDRRQIIGSYHSGTIDDARKSDVKRIIHWVPSDDSVPIEVIMENGEISKGLGEPECVDLSEGAVVQFERYGFVKVDRLKPMITVYFAHP
ncbi:MAG: glutamate--tRNA ligase [Candidatus Hodarchaeota archaeon]